MIVVTAGHIDHGKTTLIQALTEVDTDRLAEEKRRGLSIDLGFAYADFGGPQSLGFVDVPGHERFIRNMLAGVTAVDYVLLVVAADDGPMPQTYEHLAILDLLGVRLGAVALTKIDRVPASRAQELEPRIRTMLAATSLRNARLFPLSSRTGAGMAMLRTALVAAFQAHRRRAPQGHFRLAVDRCFTIKGAGRVVTGTALAGCVENGATLTVSPPGSSVRVRGLHVHNTPAGRAQAGERCALNLTGDRRLPAIGRGDWLVAPELHCPAERIDVQLRLLSTETRPLAHWSPVQLHIGAAVRNARIALLGQPTLAPGGEGLAQLVLDFPIHAAFGDRFIIRDPAARRTLGGGQVLDPFAPRRGRARAGRQSLLRCLAGAGNATDALAATLRAMPAGVLLERFGLAFNLTPAELAAVLDTQTLELITTRVGSLALDAAVATDLRQQLLTQVDIWHQDKADSIGPTQTQLLALLSKPVPPALRPALIGRLLDDGELTRTGFSLHRPGHRPRLSSADQRCLDAITPILANTGLKPPIVGELAERLDMEKAVLLSFLEHAHARGYLIRVAPNRYFLPQTLDKLARIAADLAEDSEFGTFDAAEYRDRSGIGRNLSVQVLEYLDRAGVTFFFNGRRRVQNP